MFPYKGILEDVAQYFSKITEHYNYLEKFFYSLVWLFFVVCFNSEILI